MDSEVITYSFLKKEVINFSNYNTSFFLVNYPVG